MKIWDFKPSGDLFTTVAVGAAVAAAPGVIPFAWSAVRPLLKTVLKGGFMLYETGRGACTAVAQLAGPEQAAITPAKKPTETKARIRPKPLVKTAAKKSEKRK
jgi:hypothetical protein